MAPTSPTGGVPVTCLDGFDHLVPEPVMASATDGRYAAACGRIVLPAALLAPAGPRCPLCWPATDDPRHPDRPEPERGRRRHPEARRLRSIQRRARARRGLLAARAG